MPKGNGNYENSALIESIKRAYALDTHPSNVFTQWDNETLARGTRPDDSSYDGVLAMRVTYQDSHGNPVADADFTTLLDASDSSLRDATDISTHADVWGVAIYPATRDGERSPYPLAVMIDGTPVPLDSI